MKKIILIVTCASSISAYALPTYEPFTESLFVNAIAASGSNAVDLSTGGFTAPTGESWGNMSWAGTGANRGLDILVTNKPGLFTQSALSTLLPANFPGMPATGQSIAYMLMNPAQPTQTAGQIGNSAVLIFNKDITPPATGTSTLYVSYLWSCAQKGQLGTGNDARYLAFVAGTNTVEGTSVGFYNSWHSMLDLFNNTAPGAGTARYAAHSIIAGSSGYYNIAADSYGEGKEFGSSSFTANFGAVQFIVGAITIAPNGTYNNTIWVNPATGSFGGPTPPSSPIDNDAVTSTAANAVLSDIGGMVVEDRPGTGASAGGLGSNFMANLMLGTTWSYVTGGPEFTVQPATNTVQAPATTVILNATAVAAAQSVSYQWQKVIGGTPTALNPGSGTAGGAATVSGQNTSSLTLTGVSSGDSGTYDVVAAASGTTFPLTSANAVVTVSDPGILTQPQPTTANYGGTASFTAQAVTTTAQLTYAWYHGSTLLTNGLQPDGSTVAGGQGTNAGGTVNLTLTLSNVSCADDGSYSLDVTNAASSTASTLPATLTVNDPYISVQPPATAEISATSSAVIPVTAPGTGVSYQWQWNNGNGGNANNGEITGTATSMLTISSAGASANDAGTYSVTVSGTCGGPLTSSNTIVYYDTAPISATVSPAALTQQVGTHLALVSSVAVGSGLVHLVWQLNGTNLANGTQTDGSWISGAGAVLTGTGTGALVLSNLHLLDSGTYTVIASNAAGQVSGSSSCLVTVVPVGQLTLSTNNLEVIRVGDGNEPLSGSTGNTLYLDQITTSGGYVNTIMVPDSGPSALVVAGAGINVGTNEGIQEGYLTLSSNQQYLNFGGFCYSYPFTGNADVTIGQQEPGGSVTNVRGIYALNASGIMALVYTNYGLYSGGHGFRDVYSTDGLTNFWTTGSAGSGTVKYVNAGPAGASYTITTPGSGIPALGETGANSGGVCLGLLGPNLVFSDNRTDGDNLATSVWGINEFTGAPMVSSTNAFQTLNGGEGHPDDFAISPDLQTIYVADDDFSVSYGVANPPATYGGIQRYDLVPGSGTNYQYSYNLSDTTGVGTNGMRGLTVYWPPNITSWGAGVQGAVLYATTSEVVSNRIIQIIDNNGASSTSTLLATAPANQFYRGIRFGPVPAPLSVTAPPSRSAIVGQVVDFSSVVSGVFSYYFPNTAGTGYNLISDPPTTYQWYTNGVAIPGATTTAYDIANVQSSNAGSYTFVLTTGETTITSTPPAVLTVSSFMPNADLVGWFKLNDGSGTNAADSSVYNNTAALYNFPSDNSEWVPGPGDYDVLNFANADANLDNVVLVPDAPQLNFNTGLTFTLAAWVKSTTNNQIGGAAIITKGYGNGGESYDLDIYNNLLRFFVRNSSTNVTPINSATGLTTNQWAHVVATFDGNQGLMNLYLNGQLIGTNIAPGSLLLSTNPVSIGNRTSSSTNTYDLPFQGEMEDIRIYNVALGAPDVATLYNILADTNTPPQLAPPAAFVSSGNFRLNLSGAPNTTFHLWSTTNVALTPITTTWTLVTTGTFSSTGTFTFTDTAATDTAEYYAITQP